MTDKLLTNIDKALAAFSAYQQALEDPEWGCPSIALDRLEVEMRELEDAFDESQGASK